jgi:hypothetical protein
VAVPSVRCLDHGRLAHPSAALDRRLAHPAAALDRRLAHLAAPPITAGWSNRRGLASPPGCWLPGCPHPCLAWQGTGRRPGGPGQAGANQPPPSTAAGWPPAAPITAGCPTGARWFGWRQRLPGCPAGCLARWGTGRLARRPRSGGRQPAAALDRRWLATCPPITAGSPDRRPLARRPGRPRRLPRCPTGRQPGQGTGRPSEGRRSGGRPTGRRPWRLLARRPDHGRLTHLAVPPSQVGNKSPARRPQVGWPPCSAAALGDRWLAARPPPRSWPARPTGDRWLAQPSAAPTMASSSDRRLLAYPDRSAPAAAGLSGGLPSQAGDRSFGPEAPGWAAPQPAGRP